MNDNFQRHAGVPGIWTFRDAIGLTLRWVAAYFLLTEHRAHCFGARPYLLSKIFGEPT